MAYRGTPFTSVEVAITSGINSGTIYFDGTIALSASRCSPNEFGFNVCTETGSFNGPTLSNGTYWLNLQNASLPDGDLVGWAVFFVVKIFLDLLAILWL